jgi:hypothetical protein
VAEAFDLAMKTDCTGLVWNSEKSKNSSAAKTRQRRDFPLGHLNHFGVNQTRAREQTNLRRILDHMIVRNQITIVRDEKARAGAARL